MSNSVWLKEWERKTLSDLWETAVERYSDNEVAVSGNSRFTYKEMDERINMLARGLVSLGIKKGDKIAIWMPNNFNWLLAEFAVIKAGGIMVPLSTRFKSYDLQYILRQSDSVAILSAARLGKIDFYEILIEVCPEIEHNEPGKLASEKVPFLKTIVIFDDEPRSGCFSANQIMLMVKETPPEEISRLQAETAPKDVVNIPYTSGTTGFPKGVMTTHEQYLGQTVCFRERLGIHKKDRFIAIAPFFANFGNYFGILLPVMVGGCSIMIEAYDPALAIKLIEQERATHFSGTPTMYLDILHHPDFAGTNMSTLRTAMTGAAPAPVQMVKDVYSKMGVDVLCNGYGMTENSGCTTMTKRGDPPEVLAETTGQPFPGVSICIKDPKTKEILGARQIGELCTKGWIVMKGYYKMESETAESFDAEDWFHTGDLGMLDEHGNFIITGRLKEMFISGGFNVYPAEVENFLYSMPGIEQVAIVGVPDQRMGEVGMAFIMANPNYSLSEAQIISYCKGRIASYKVPRYVVFIDQMPVAGVGKVQKFLLREEGLSELNRRGITI
jgi:fatty-acyl-CoA synthase